MYEALSFVSSTFEEKKIEKDNVLTYLREKNIYMKRNFGFLNSTTKEAETI